MEAKDILKKIALETFGTNDGNRPCFPSSGEKIQKAMEISFRAGEQAADKKWRQILKDSVALAKLAGDTGRSIQRREFLRG